MSWISLNAQWAIASGALTFETKQLSVDQCTYKFNTTNLFLNITSKATTE